MWSDSLAAEGWGLYAEELMAEPVAGRPYGFYSAPEYLYELQGQMMRAVRVRVDVGLHTGRMTFDEARDYYVEHVEFYPGACGRKDRMHARRATPPIARSTATRSGRRRRLPTTWARTQSSRCESRPEKATGTAYSPRAFHERFMRMGTVPVVFFSDVFEGPVYPVSRMLSAATIRLRNRRAVRAASAVRDAAATSASAP